MGLLPQVELGGTGGALVSAMILGVLVLWIFTTTGGALLLGAGLLLLAVLAAYYVIVRADRWARGGRKRGR